MTKRILHKKITGDCGAEIIGNRLYLDDLGIATKIYCENGGYVQVNLNAIDLARILDGLCEMESNSKKSDKAIVDKLKKFSNRLQTKCDKNLIANIRIGSYAVALAPVSLEYSERGITENCTFSTDTRIPSFLRHEI